MMCSDNVDTLPNINALRGPYNPSIASSASSSHTSVWSDAASQSSDDTSTSVTSDSSSQDSETYCASNHIRVRPTTWTHNETRHEISTSVPQELRLNPRRTASRTNSKAGCPPSLVRQGERKVNFVDNLVESSTQIVEAIWPLSHVHRQEACSKTVLPLRTFIAETLRRSRTSYSTLQVALYYLVLIKPHVPNRDFTMEQPDDSHTSRVLQCGRRMFLAALILASKYLQDRNYSARAWSKISGLQTHEINQNEMAFLLAVNWKLHITDEVFKRWADVVMKYTPSQPSTPGSPCSAEFEQQCRDWRALILHLNPELDNIGDLVWLSPLKPQAQEYALPVSPRSVIAGSRERLCSLSNEAADATPTPRSYKAPVIMEPPAPTSVYTPGRQAPALGLLPTPRLTPQTTGLSTPAAGVASQFLNPRCSMGLAMSQASNAMAAQNMDRWPGSGPRSPTQGYLTRRSSLATSVSSASSPESMISDTSLTSRSSSISSASSFSTAPATKLDVQARCRNARLCSERYGARPSIASVREDYSENCLTSSPESYAGPVGKDLMAMSLSNGELDDATNAARALHDLQFYNRPARQGLKRSCPSVDSSLQENVRQLLRDPRLDSLEQDWTTDLATAGERKRVCRMTPPSRCSIPTFHPAMGGPGAPGMWSGILS